MILSSPQLANGTYSLYKGGSISGESAFYGLYTGSFGYSAGTKVDSVAVSSPVTKAGSITNGGAQEGDRPTAPGQR